MSGDNGKIIGGIESKDDNIKEQPEEKVATDEQGHLAKIKVGDTEYKVVNSAEVIGIWVHKLENGQEVSQVIAHEFMMVDHKAYMIRLLTDAIMTVMRAKNRASYIKLVSEAMFNKLRNRTKLRNFLRNKK
jgi:hypothetical protein